MDYDFDAKQTGFRAPAWMFADRMCKTPRAFRRVAVLDTAQGLEVRHLLSLGYRPENILAVNYSAAILAAMTLALRRDGIEGVQTKAGPFAAAVVKAGGRRHVLSFDTTSNLRSTAFGDLTETIRVTTPEVLILVMLAGREAGQSSCSLEVITERCSSRHASNGSAVLASHVGRLKLSAILALTGPSLGCPGHLVKQHFGRYVSTSGQPMVWGVSALTPCGKRGAAFAPCCIPDLDKRAIHDVSALSPAEQRRLLSRGGI